MVWDEILAWLPYLLPVADLALIVGTISWVLMTKTEVSSAIAWCLIIVLVPFLGAFLFFIFGYQQVQRPLRRKMRHKQRYKMPAMGSWSGMSMGEVSLVEPTIGSAFGEEGAETVPQRLARVATRVGAWPISQGNAVDIYHEGAPAFAAMLDAIRTAEHHIHLEFFIFQPDELGCEFLKLLAEKAKNGVHVRLITDAIGAHRLKGKILYPLVQAGGVCYPFLPVSLFRRKLQINMRNHRKILVVDGKVGFVGGLNIGDEYLGKVAHFGYWRDTHLRLRGASVLSLQRIFVEDWDFAANEHLSDPRFFPTPECPGNFLTQILDSGPDRELKSIREIYFAAILKARKRVWIASPYFVPDTGILDALRLASFLGVDVRLLCQFHPDKWIPQYAARYYWAQMLSAGVKVYQYAKGMMHAKVFIVDDDWASVGTANLDNRSLFLNFEVNCLLYSHEAVKELSEQYERDLAESIELEPRVYQHRPGSGRFLENAARLLSPVL